MHLEIHSTHCYVKRWPEAKNQVCLHFSLAFPKDSCGIGSTEQVEEVLCCIALVGPLARTRAPVLPAGICDVTPEVLLLLQEQVGR